MFGIGFIELVVIFAATILVVVPFWVIFTKAGFSPFLSLLIPIPGVNFVVLYYFAFSTWPSHKQSARARSSFDPIHPS